MDGWMNGLALLFLSCVACPRPCPQFLRVCSERWGGQPCTSGPGGCAGDAGAERHQERRERCEAQVRCVVCVVSCVLCPVSCVLCPVSCIVCTCRVHLGERLTCMSSVWYRLLFAVCCPPRLLLCMSMFVCLWCHHGVLCGAREHRALSLEIRSLTEQQAKVEGELRSLRGACVQELSDLCSPIPCLHLVAALLVAGRMRLVLHPRPPCNAALPVAGTLAAPSSSITRCVTVVLEVHTACTVTLHLSYLVSHASWKPKYDIR
jgi:hypothetical protein